MKIITILDHSKSTIYHYNIIDSQIEDIEIFLDDKGLSNSNTSYMITKDLTVFDNRINNMMYEHINTKKQIDPSLVAPSSKWEYYTNEELSKYKDYKYAVVDNSFNKVLTSHCIELEEYNNFIDIYEDNIN